MSCPTRFLNVYSSGKVSLKNGFMKSMHLFISSNWLLCCFIILHLSFHGILEKEVDELFLLVGLNHTCNLIGSQL